jgi:hypothetical protein
MKRIRMLNIGAVGQASEGSRSQSRAFAAVRQYRRCVRQNLGGLKFQVQR